MCFAFLAHVAVAAAAAAQSGEASSTQTQNQSATAVTMPALLPAVALPADVDGEGMGGFGGMGGFDVTDENVTEGIDNFDLKPFYFERAMKLMVMGEELFGNDIQLAGATILRNIGHSGGHDGSGSGNGNGNDNVEMGSGGCSPAGANQSRVCEDSYTICGPKDVEVLASHCCRELRGDLRIQPAQRCSPPGATPGWRNAWFLSLEGLSSITSITGDLVFDFTVACPCQASMHIGDKALAPYNAACPENEDDRICIVMDSFQGLHNLRQVGGSVLVSGKLDCGFWLQCVESLSSLLSLEEIGRDLRLLPDGSLYLLPQIGSGPQYLDSQVGHGMDVVVPSLRRVNGTVQLRSITNVDMTGLASLREVGGDFEVGFTSSLTSLAGLEGLTRIGGSLLLKDIIPPMGLEFVLRGIGNTTIQGFQLRGRNNVRSMEGFPPQRRLQTLHIEGAHLLEEIEWCKELQEVTGSVVIQGTAIKSLQGLRSLRSVGLDLQIRDNPGLQDLEGLAALREINGSFLIQGNTGLSSLRGFSTADLPFVRGGVEILDNQALQSLEGLEFDRASQVVVSNSPLQHLGTSFSGWSASGCPGRIQGRVLKIDPLTARPRCVTPLEWERALSQWMNVESGEPKGWDEWHSNGCGTNNSNSTCWLGADCHINVSGVSSWDGTSGVALPLCGLSCGPCRNQSQAFAALGSQTVNVRELLRRASPGNQVLCHCSGDASGRGPITEILLAGPSGVKFYSCVRGHNCSLAVPGEGFVAGSTVQIMSEKCLGGQLAAEATFQPSSGTFDVLDWLSLARQKSGTYLVCWTSPPGASCPTCTAPDTLEIGSLILQGPFDVQLEAALDGGLRLANLGVGMRDEDKLEILETCGLPWQHRHRHRLSATSSDLQFEVALDRSIVQATQYHLCWCRPTANGSQGSQGSQCAGPEDFVVDFGSLLVTCPPQEALTGDGCQPCPAGTSLRTTDGVCTVDQAYVALLSAQSLLLFTAVTLAVALLRLPLKIEDCYTQNGKVVVEFAQPHWLRMYGHKSFRVRTQGTTHPGLKLPLQARVRSKEALELFLPKGERLGRVDESTGALRLSLTRELMHVGWPAPLGVTLVLLLMLVVGFLVAVPQQLKHTGIGSGSAVLAALLLGALLRRQTPTSLKKKLVDFGAQLLEQNPCPKAVPKGPTRAIDLRDLYDIMEAFGSFVRDRNAYYMDTNIFQPITARYKLSYAEVVGPKQVQWFVSHYWGNPFADLCNALRKHAETVFIPGQCSIDSIWKTTYWICFLSNNQHQVSDELGADWSESSFYITLRSGFCRGVCMILDEGVQPLTRSWCIFELLQTLLLESNDQNFAGLLLCTEEGTLNYGQGTVEVAFNLVQRIADLDLASARASCQNDKDMINAQVIQELGSFDKMKDLVRVKLHAILVTAQGTASANFQRLFQLVQP